jgi:non-specific serine/threonine protein kinase
MTATDLPIGGPPRFAPDLPVHMTDFIGRDRELSELRRLMQSVRMLTLTGAGGSSSGVVAAVG